jgi:RND family efflux transporter MFP subunit
MGKPYRWAVVVAVTTAVVLAAIVMTRGGGDDLQVQTAEVTVGPIARRVLVSGTLEPARLVEIGSQVSGTIASLDADFNSRVKAGQVVARLDPASFHTRLVDAEAGVIKARAERARFQAALDDARRKFDSAQALAGDAQLARAELDLARTTMLQAAADVKAADAGITAAQAGVTEARVNLDRTVIRSPIDGVVIGRQVDVGQTIAAAVNAPTLFTVGDLRRMRLLVEVPEGEVGGVQPGSQVRFEIEALGSQAFTGTVAEVRLAPLNVPAAAATSGSGASTPSGSTATTSGSSRTAAAAPATQPQPPAAAPTTPGGASSRQTGQTTAAPAATTTPSTQAQPAATGVVTYVAVIDVDNPNQEIPPGGTAIVTLSGSERPQAVRIPNNALTFAPSAEALAAVDQKTPVLNRPDEAPVKGNATQQDYVWKVENNRFVPIAVKTGIADDSWTELVGGDVRPRDLLVTAAVPRAR